MSKLSLGVQKAAQTGAVVDMGPNGRYVELDRKVDAAEGDGIMARWEFGREVLAERVGKQLPKGRLDEIAAAIGKTTREVQYRAAFFVRFPSLEEVRNAVSHFGSWHEIVAEALTVNPRLGAEDRANARLAAILPPGRFNVILADPPWRYDFSPTDSRAIENQYPTLDLDEIRYYHDDGHRSILDAIADDAALFMWATSPKLTEALAVMDAWGFTYTTNAVWVKDRIGMGFYVRQQHELLLIGKRGDMPPPPDPTTRQSSVIEAAYQGHSVKPDEVYGLIEGMYPVATRLECFARRGRPGWTPFGNEPTP
jgi:N6-adenosine-specific RNA methylase IME4